MLAEASATTEDICLASERLVAAAVWQHIMVHPSGLSAELPQGSRNGTGATAPTLPHTTPWHGLISLDLGTILPVWLLLLMVLSTILAPIQQTTCPLDISYLDRQRACVDRGPKGIACHQLPPRLVLHVHRAIHHKLLVPTHVMRAEQASMRIN